MYLFYSLFIVTMLLSDLLLLKFLDKYQSWSALLDFFQNIKENASDFLYLEVMFDLVDKRKKISFKHPSRRSRFNKS